MALDLGRDVGRASTDPQGREAVLITAPGDSLSTDVWVFAAVAGCRASDGGTGFSAHAPITWSADGLPVITVVAEGGILLDAGADAGFLFSVVVVTNHNPGDFIQANGAPDISQWALTALRIKDADGGDPLAGQSPIAFGTDADPSIITVPSFDVEVDGAILVWIMGGSFVGTNPVTAEPAGLDRVGAINSGVTAYTSFCMMAVDQSVAQGATAPLVSGGVPKSGGFAWNCRAAGMALAIRGLAPPLSGVRFAGTVGTVATFFALPT